MKRIFIAVGSEATKGLEALINRLYEENIFSKFDDQYIAIDSMQSQMDEFNQIRDRLRTKRIQGFVLKMDPRDMDVTCFQKEWTFKDVPAGGVGGSREISGKAVSMIRQIWLNPDLQLDNNLHPDDHIILLGSAFGGTAGGMFPNLCEYLDLRIRQKRNANPNFKNVQVLGFLLMPKATDNQASYPVALNMIDLFSDLQRISWRRRLETKREGFKVPVWSQYNNGFFPLYNGPLNLSDYGIQGSTLPIGNLYLIPTPMDGTGYQTSIFAESLFVATYLRVDEGHGRWVNRLLAGGSGAHDNLNVEDPCFAGFNLFSMKSGRMISLKNWFYKELLKIFDGEDGRRGLLSVAAENKMVRSNIATVFQKAQVPEKDDQSPWAGVPRQTGNALDNLLNAKEEALSSLRSLKAFVGTCSDYLNALEAQVSGFSVLSPNTLVALLGCGSPEYSKWNREMNFPLIQQGYEQFYSMVQTESNQMQDYRDTITSKLNAAYQLIEKRLQNRVVKNEFWGLDAKAEVFREIVNHFDSFFAEYLRYFLFACRCSKTTFITPQIFKGELDRISGTCNIFRRVIEENIKNLQKIRNPYVVEGTLVEPLTFPPNSREELHFDPMQIIMAYVFRTFPQSAATNDQLIHLIQSMKGNDQIFADPGKSASQLLEREQENVITRFIEIASRLPDAANPLTGATFASFTDKCNEGLCKTFTPDLAVADTDEFHYHFVVRQGTGPATISNMRNSDVQSAPLNLTTMPNCAESSSSFFGTSHKIGMSKDEYWFDENSLRLFEGKRPDQNLNIQGLWIGTLGIDFKVHDILNRLYSSVPQVQNALANAGRAALHPRRLMTTDEMVCLGLVIETIEKKMKEMYLDKLQQSPYYLIAQDHAPVSISFKKQETNQTFVLSEGTSLSDLGFVDQQMTKTCYLEKISKEWVEKLLLWIRDSSTLGFHDFFGSVADFASGIHNTESNVFQTLRFSIHADETDAMDNLVRSMLSRIQIQL